METPDTVESLQAALSRSPFDTKLLHRLAVLYCALGDYPNAGKILERILKFQKKTKEVIVMLADCYWRTGEDQKCISTLTQLRKLPDSKDDWESHYRLGLLYEKHGEFSQAEKELKIATERNKSLFSAWKSLGISREAIGKFEDAIEPYQNAQSLTTDDSEVIECYCSIARCQCRSQRFQHCLETLNHLASSAPLSYKVAKVSAWCRYHMRDFEGAERIVHKALALSMGADLVDLRCLWGLAVMGMQRFDHAFPIISSLVVSEPESPISWTYYGLLYACKQQTEYAYHCFRKALDFDSRYPEALLNLSLLYRDSGQEDVAIACYEKVKEIAGYEKLQRVENLVFPVLNWKRTGGFLAKPPKSSLSVEVKADLSWLVSLRTNKETPSSNPAPKGRSRKSSNKSESPSPSKQAAVESLVLSPTPIRIPAQRSEAARVTLPSIFTFDEGNRK